MGVVSRVVILLKFFSPPSTRIVCQPRTIHGKLEEATALLTELPVALEGWLTGDIMDATQILEEHKLSRMQILASSR